MSLSKTKIFQYLHLSCRRVTYNFHKSCKHMHLSFKSVCNKEHKGVVCNMTSSSNFSKNGLSFLDYTPNYEWTSGIFVPCFILCLELVQNNLENENLQKPGNVPT